MSSKQSRKASRSKASASTVELSNGEMLSKSEFRNSLDRAHSHLDGLLGVHECKLGEQFVGPINLLALNVFFTKLPKVFNLDTWDYVLANKFEFSAEQISSFYELVEVEKLLPLAGRGGDHKVIRSKSNEPVPDKFYLDFKIPWTWFYQRCKDPKQATKECCHISNLHYWPTLDAGKKTDSVGYVDKVEAAESEAPKSK